jgi:hypothetical protein
VGAVQRVWFVNVCALEKRGDGTYSTDFTFYMRYVLFMRTGLMEGLSAYADCIRSTLLDFTLRLGSYEEEFKKCVKVCYACVSAYALVCMRKCFCLRAHACLYM